MAESTTLSASEVLRRYRASDRDFRHLQLAAVDLRGADLRHADFSHANLEGANLEGANLEGTLFVGADLRNANLEGVSVVGADFTAADLAGARSSSNLLPLEIPLSQTDRALMGPTRSLERSGDTKVPTFTREMSLVSVRDSELGRTQSGEIQRLSEQLQGLRLWQGITTAIALGFLFVTVLGGYLGYAQYRDSQNLRQRLGTQIREREERLTAARAEIEDLQQQKLTLERRLQGTDERLRESEIQISALRQQLETASAQLRAERERAEQLAETNQIVTERLEKQRGRRPWPFSN